MIWSLAFLAALAHVPHAVVSGVAIPRQDPTLAWYLALNCEVPTGLYRSYDEGATWEAFAGLPMQDELTDAAYTDDGYAVFLGASRLWWTIDGVTWGEAPLRERPVGQLSPMAGGDQIYLPTASGIYSFAPGGAPSLEMSDEGVSSVHEGEDGPVAISDTDHVWWRHDGVWESLGSPALDPVWSGTSGNGTVFAGTDNGEVYWWTGDRWATCGAVPLGNVGDTHGMITHLDYHDGRLLVTRADVGPALSTDDCASWTDIRSPNYNEFVDSGAAAYTTDDVAFVAAVSYDDVVFTAGFDGASSSRDGGATWHFSPIIGPDFTQALAFSRAVETDGVVLLASYGSGISRATAWGATVETSASGLADPNGEDLYVDPASTSASPAYGVFNLSPFYSTDEGATWAELPGITGSVRQLDYGLAGRIYAAGTESTEEIPGAVLRSEDGGSSWARLDNLPADLSTETVVRVLDRTGYLCLQTVYRVICSTDDGATWTQIHEATASTDRVLFVSAWPASAPTAILITDHDGIWRWDGSALTGVYDTSSVPEVLYVEPTDNDLLYALDAAGSLLESVDGGLTWSDTTLDVPMQSATLVARPDFATWGELLAGGLDGTYLIHDGVVERFAPYQRIDDSGQFHTCTNCAADRFEPAVLGSVATMDAGDTLEVNLRGSTLRMTGASSTGAVVTLTLDGTALGEVKIPMVSGAVDTLWQATGLDDGWHRVEFTVGVGELLFDGFEGWGVGAELGHASPPDTGETGDTAETGETGTVDTDTAPPEETDPIDTDTAPPDTDESVGETDVTDDTDPVVGSETGDPPLEVGKDCACGAGGPPPAAALIGLLAWVFRRSRAPGRRPA